MTGLTNLTGQKRLMLERLVNMLGEVAGMAAVVLGGSYATGTFREASDLDVGLYYLEDQPFSVADISRIADGISENSPATVTGFYEWGPWVNGGAWIRTDLGKVDFLYRNLDQVQRTITDAQRGIVQHDFDQQPTYGFYSVIYLAETSSCIPLHDPAGHIARLKRQVEVYPPQLKQMVIADSLWAAEFTIHFARAFAAQGDVYNTVGCLTRVLSSLTQALFALNERYFMSDKRVMETLASFITLPAGYVEQARAILACPGWKAGELTRTVEDLGRIWQSVVALAGEYYRPRFQV